jgi:hypothetical protein
MGASAFGSALLDDLEQLEAILAGVVYADAT